jgi:phospholipid/cholesterol/gamma-HCH transport system substrate-binding protein
VSIGAETSYMQPGDTFYGTQSALNIERLISNFASGK